MYGLLLCQVQKCCAARKHMYKRFKYPPSTGIRGARFGDRECRSPCRVHLTLYDPNLEGSNTSACATAAYTKLLVSYDVKNTKTRSSYKSWLRSWVDKVLFVRGKPCSPQAHDEDYKYHLHYWVGVSRFANFRNFL